MADEVRILMLEDLPTDEEMILYELRKAGIVFTAKRVATREEFEKEIQTFRPNLILADYAMPTFDGISALAIAQEKAQEVPFIFVSGNIGEDEAIEMTRMGATDYVLKSRLSRLVPSVRRALQEAEEHARRKAAEAALAESIELLERIFLNIHVLIAYMDTDFNFIRVNNAYAKVNGGEPGFHVGKNHFDLYPSEENRAIFRKVAATGEPYFAYERPFVYADPLNRSLTYWDWTLQPVRGPDGKVTGLLLTLVDRTEHRRATDALGQKMRDQAALHSASQIFLDIIDETTTLENACRLVVEHFGLMMAWAGLVTKGDYTVRPAWAYGFEEDYLKDIRITWDDSPSGRGPIGEAIRTRKAVAMNHIENDPTFAPWLEAAMARGYRSAASLPLCYGDDVLGVLAVYGESPEFFTQDRVVALQSFANLAAVALAKARLYAEVQRSADKLERKVEERTQQLQETNKELESFSYSISHDLRAPLWAMQGFAKSLLEEESDKLSAEGKEDAERIVAAAQRMERMIEDILAYSRMSKAEIELCPERLETVVGEALERLEGDLKSRNVRVTVHKPLPQVLAHRPTLVNIVGNLIANSAKFVAADTQPDIHIEAGERQGWVRLWVRDNGIGIAAKDHERIFRLFERLHSDEKYPGTGLGLAIVRRGVLRMGGRVGVESEPGKGSRFWVELRKG